ncbi:MAG TPA: glycosyltransferase family 39 protein [Methylomirabilota bacterium]|nr:glycosyltransferase family 39 protein [Methylomirabilota bacterium]
MLRLVLSFLPPLATGWIIVGALGVGTSPDWRHRLLRGALAAGLGLGLTSCAFFLAMVLAGSSLATALTTDALLLVGALSLRRLCPAGSPPPAARPAPARPAPTWLWLLRTSGGLALGGALVGGWLFGGLQPHGAWDAWGIWNLRARFLFRGGVEWRDGLSPLVAWSHPDYPLLLPGLVARAWWYTGRDTPQAPLAIACVFGAATVALVFAAVATLRNEGQGWLAALVLAGTPEFLRQAMNQIADVPLAFYFLAALVLLALADHAAGRQGGLVGLTGVALGLAAWTKNEGLAGALAVLLAGLAVAVCRGGWRWRLPRELAPAAVGLIPVLLVVAYFKLRLAPPSEYLALTGLARLGDPGRYAAITRLGVDELGGFGGWPLSVLAILLPYALAMGVRVAPAARASAARAVLAIVLTAAAYAGVYLVTPHPLEWHLATSLSRLLIQLWPASLFAYFLVVASPPLAGRSEERSAGAS